MNQSKPKGFAFDSPDAAIEALLGRIGPVPTETVGLDSSIGRVLAERIETDRPSPSVDLSAMDGYAVRLAGLKPGKIAVGGDVMIGRKPPPMPDDAALRIVTGAPVPAGADAVIKREDLEELGDSIELDAQTLGQVQEGQNIRRRAENAEQGHTVLEPGELITPAAAAALGFFGKTQPLVYRRVRIGIVTTGDEVLLVSQEPSEWEIRDSNGTALRAMFSTAPWAEVVKSEHAIDDRDEIQRTVEDVLDSCDALVMTGGVSMGDRDFVPGVLRDVGAEVVFHKLPQRPGKPILGAVGPRGQAILALPGNPVSVLVTARRIAADVLAHQAGLKQVKNLAAVSLTNADDKKLNMWWHRAVRLVEPGQAELLAGRGSGDLVHVATSDGFVEIPPHSTGPGPWPFYPWSL